jgi:hypothetical protein
MTTNQPFPTAQELLNISQDKLDIGYPDTMAKALAAVLRAVAEGLSVDPKEHRELQAGFYMAVEQLEVFADNLDELYAYTITSHRDPANLQINGNLL